MAQPSGNPVTGAQMSLPPQGLPVLAGTTFVQSWYIFFRALYQFAGNGTGLLTFNGQTASAPPTTQAAQLAPNLAFVAAGGGSVQLSAGLAPNQVMVVVNTVASKALKVFPPPGGQIDALGINAPYTMNPGGAKALPTTQLFWVQSVSGPQSSTAQAPTAQLFSTQLG